MEFRCLKDGKGRENGLGKVLQEPVLRHWYEVSTVGQLVSPITAYPH